MDLTRQLGWHPMNHGNQWGNTPVVWRGAASDWPAVQRWSFDHLGSLAPEQLVRVVHGNRELQAAHLVTTTWGKHLSSLQGNAANAGHLKEFDLLKHFPKLAQDLRLGSLFPPGAVVSNQAWIGPAQARTGLHHDLLDNVAVTVRGRKRFYLLPPGSIEGLGLVSSKFDRWARLAKTGVDALMATPNALPANAVQVVDLAPGDALYVPHGWWHEVVNLEASVLLSGFFGSKRRAWAYWLATGAQQAAHNMDLWRSGDCTCHHKEQS